MTTSSGITEEFRAGVHLALFGLAVTAGLYNLGESQSRPEEKHLKLNVLVYIVLAVFEWLQITRHLRDL